METKRAAIYCRISDDRGGDALGVKRQEQACQKLAARHGWEVVVVFVDNDISAYSGKDRPGYQAMVEAIKAGEITAIVAWAPARLTRHPRELEDLIDLLEAHRIEVATHIAGDYDLSTSGGRLTARVVGSVARHESEEKSERIKLKMAEIARTGTFHGGRRPYGYAADGVTIIPAEAEVIRWMARRVGEGLGLRRLEAEMNDKAIPTVHGGPWSFTTISRILTSPRIAGLSHHRGEIVGKADWDPILDRATWDHLQAILHDPRRKQARPARYLLSGLAYTPGGAKMTGARTRHNRRVYKAVGCQLDADQAERFVLEVALDLTDAGALPKAKAVRVTSDVAAIEAELEELSGLRGKNRITLREWMTAREEVMKRLDKARQAVPPVAVPAGLSAILGRKGGLRAAWTTLSDDQQRRALAAVVEKIIVHPTGPVGREFNTDRIEIVPRRP